MNDGSDRSVAGIGFLLTGIAVFSVQDVVLKLLSAGYSVFQIVFIRSWVAIVCITIVLMLTEGRSGFRAFSHGWLMLRGAFMLGAYITYYLAIAALPLADVVAIAFAAPLFMVMLTKPFLGENVSKREWLAVVVGFVGVLIMVRPSGSAAQFASLLALLSALCYAMASLVTRRVTSGESSWTLAFYANLVFAAGSVVGWFVSGTSPTTEEHPSLAFLTRAWRMPGLLDSALIAATGVIAAAGHFCLAQAYRLGTVGRVAPFEYAYLLLAVTLGYMFFGDIPTPTTLVGAAIICGTGLYILWLSARQTAIRR